MTYLRRRRGGGKQSNRQGRIRDRSRAGGSRRRPAKKGGKSSPLALGLVEDEVGGAVGAPADLLHHLVLLHRSEGSSLALVPLAAAFLSARKEEEEEEKRRGVPRQLRDVREEMRDREREREGEESGKWNNGGAASRTHACGEGRNWGGRRGEAGRAAMMARG